MIKALQKSANSYHVVIGEIIDNTSSSAFLILPWRAINKRGEIQDFKTKQEAIDWIAK